MGTAPPAARVSDPKGIENEKRICVHYLWSGVTILNLLFPISPLFAFFSFSPAGESISFLVLFIMIDLQFKGTLLNPSLRWDKTQT